MLRFSSVVCNVLTFFVLGKAECAAHEATAHDRTTPYNCKDCEMSFGDRAQFSAHLKSVHQNDKPYNCPECERTFARRSDLRKHTVVHTGIKPFTCSICLKSFSRNTNLSKHMRIHSGQKPFVCPKCPKTFISRGECKLFDHFKIMVYFILKIILIVPIFAYYEQWSRIINKHFSNHYHDNNAS